MRLTAINFIESEENEGLELRQRSSHIGACVLEISIDVGESSVLSWDPEKYILYKNSISTILNKVPSVWFIRFP